MSMQVFPTAPSPTVTHLMNLAVLIFELSAASFPSFTFLASKALSLSSSPPLIRTSLQDIYFSVSQENGETIRQKETYWRVLRGVFWILNRKGGDEWHLISWVAQHSTNFCCASLSFVFVYPFIFTMIAIGFLFL